MSNLSRLGVHGDPTEDETDNYEYLKHLNAGGDPELEYKSVLDLWVAGNPATKEKGFAFWFLSLTPDDVRGLTLTTPAMTKHFVIDDTNDANLRSYLPGCLVVKTFDSNQTFIDAFVEYAKRKGVQIRIDRLVKKPEPKTQTADMSAKTGDAYS